MKKKGPLAIVLIVTMLFFAGTAWAGAADQTGYYYLDAVRIDGTPWVDVPPAEIITGTDYNVEVDLRYEVYTYLAADQLLYSTSQTILIDIDGMEVYNATAANPYYIDYNDSFTNQVDYAKWTVAGVLNYNALIDPEGIYTAHIAREGWWDDKYDGFKGICSDVSREVNISNPVPEPATMFLLGTGLLGLAVVRRRYVKKNS